MPSTLRTFAWSISIPPVVRFPTKLGFTVRFPRGALFRPYAPANWGLASRPFQGCVGILWTVVTSNWLPPYHPCHPAAMRSRGEHGACAIATATAGLCKRCPRVGRPSIPRALLSHTFLPPKYCQPSVLTPSPPCTYDVLVLTDSVLDIGPSYSFHSS